MSAACLLTEVKRHGASVVVDGGQLKVRAPVPLPDDLFEQLRVHKAELLRELPEIARLVELDSAAAEGDRVDAMAEALTEKSGAFINDGFDLAEADRCAVVVVQCRSCQHYQPDAINPDGGMGTCRVSAWPLSVSAVSSHRLGMAPWPDAPRRCEAFQAIETYRVSAGETGVLRLNWQSFRHNGQ